MKTVERDNAMGSASGAQMADPNQEVSLKSDRKTIEELRKNIPEPIRTENDMVRETLSLMGEVKERPDRIRTRFQKQMRKLRTNFQKRERKERDKYRKEEKKRRDEFLKGLKKERDDFKGRKVDRDQRKDFYNEQDEKRKEFFANERDARKEFESTQRQESNDFNAMYREQNREFDREYRNYKKRYDEHIKMKKEGKLPAQKSYQPLTTDQ